VNAKCWCQGCATILAAVALVTGCGAGKTIARLASEEADDVAHVASTKWVAKSVSVAELRVVPAAEVQGKAQTLAERVSDLKTDDAVEVVKTACEIREVIKATGSPSSAVTYLRDKGKSGWVYAQKAKDLADELAKAESSSDRSWLLGAAALCEAANQQSK